jgi:hypothetical protein
MQRISSVNIYCNSIKYKKNFNFFLTKLSSKNKKQIEEVKESPTKEHQDEIFNVYQQWIINDFSIDIDLEQFDTNELIVNIVDQITPRFIQTGTNIMTSLQDKAISHLNCNDYRNTYDKFNEIVNLQKNFNDLMNIFLEKHKNRIKKIVKTENFTPDDESLNMSLRFFFIKSRAYEKSPSAVDWELDNFKPFTILLDDISDRKLDIFNPFRKKETELKEYLKKNYEEIIESIENFEKDMVKVKQSVIEFQNMLKLIVDNKIKGLKGECDSCGKLNDSEIN